MQMKKCIRPRQREKEESDMFDCKLQIIIGITSIQIE